MTIRAAPFYDNNNEAAYRADIEQRLPSAAAKAAGPTTGRPSRPYVGQMFFDTDVGLPIWFDSADWIDAAGNVV
jgi:hypothetical protein